LGNYFTKRLNVYECFTQLKSISINGCIKLYLKNVNITILNIILEMVSTKAIFKTIVLDVIFGLIAFMQYYVVNSAFELFGLGFTTVSVLYSITLFKNYLILILSTMYGFWFKWIDKDKREFPKPKYFGEFHVYTCSATFIEASTVLFLSLFLPFTSNLANIGDFIASYILFFPIMFGFEVIFDFFHYWIHRASHNGFLYKYLHKTHHKHRYPTGIITFYQDPIDLVLSNSIPSILSFWILMCPFGIPINFFQLSLISVFKTMVEIGGHLGKEMAPLCSCPQFIWLPRWLGWELYVEDHDIHHTDFNYNFAKRFGLWDKIFGTYKKPLSLKK